jgi:CubicO group peptidase (beta-lactamase class C family)
MRRLTKTGVALLAVLCGTVAGAADAPPSDVPPAIQTLRWHMLDAGVDTLTFHSMDQIFTTRKVGHAGPVWELPADTRPMDFTYRFGDETVPADAFLERAYTNALLIMKDGKIVTEIYRNNTGADTRFMSWSMAKSITSTLVGLALSEHRITSLDDPIVTYLPELKDGAYKDVTIRQVLEMRSGVDYEERYDFDNPGTAATNHIDSLIKNVTRFADMARTLKQKHKPGAVFEYKTIDTAVLGWLVERVSGMTASAYLASRVWEPLGAQSDGFFIMDGPPGVGREFTGAGFNATLRDYARFGQMVLNGGVANGHRIVPADWLAQATVPAVPSDPKANYGYQWWTIPNSHAFYALGLQGQFIYVDPDTKTVVVKLSYFPPGDDKPYGESLAFLAAASHWTPK